MISNFANAIQLWLMVIMIRQVLENCMSLAAEIMFILSGQVRNCIVKEIREKDSMEYLKRNMRPVYDSARRQGYEIWML